MNPSSRRSLFRLPGVLMATVAATVALAAQTQPKIALVNLKTLFDGYWKTKQADVQLKDHAGEFDKARKDIVDEFTKANEDYRKLLESASDQAVSPDERDKRKKAAESKLVELQEIKQNLDQFDRNARTQLGDQQLRMRNNILREIRELIDKRARASGYNLVLDGTGEGYTQTPIVLFSSGLPDLTDEILAKLNEAAPAGALTANLSISGSATNSTTNATSVLEKTRPDAAKDKPEDFK